MNRSLAAEGRLIGRYLLGAEPPPDLVERYCEADAALFPESPSAADRSILAFVSRHPWSLSPLESALGLIRPSARLRRKVLVMMAVLETSPQHVDRFEPLSLGVVTTSVRLLFLGAVGVAKICVGLAVYGVARRSPAEEHDGR